MRAVERLAQEGGLATRWDGVGNLIVELPGTAEQEGWVETGSHLDTVPGGGNYDGAAGVVAGLAMLLAVRRAGLRLDRGLRLRVWRGEESATFGAVSLGSRAAFGLLPPETLDATYQGQTLREAMAREEGHPDWVAAGHPAIDAAERDGIAAYVELHIEQGRVLEQAGIDLGIVTGIRGSVRSWVRVRGRFDHSGATPMGTAYRNDVNLAIAHMQVALDELLQRQGAVDLVQTVGVVNSHPDQSALMAEVGDNAIAKVSGAGYFSHEVRSCSGALAEDFAQAAFGVIRQVAERFGVAVEIETFSRLPGIETLDRSVQSILEAACRGSGANCQKLSSGAWHDAAVVAGVRRSDGSPIPVGMLFIPCRDGISHNPAELASDRQIAVGANVLLRAMVGLAQG